MNRRNFVVGLGTVATISGVASVTSAAFNQSVSPSTNFQVVPVDAQLVVQRLQDSITGTYNDLATGNASWNASEITDFGNVTGEQGSPVVAHLNTSENGQLGAQLAFNNTNNSGSEKEYTQYTIQDAAGFFEVANLGDTDEEIAVDLVPFENNIGDTDEDALTEAQVYEMFTFEDDIGNAVSPADSSSNPPNSISIPSGEVRAVGLSITITNEMYGNIQTAAGGAFESTDSSIRLLDEVTVGTDPDLA